jgi:predicted Zn finger-like uncharacterized protein
VIITCPRCGAQYRYDIARFGELQRKRVKCPKCTAVFEVSNPSPSGIEATLIGGAILPPLGAPGQMPSRQEPEPAELPELSPLPTDLRFSLAVIIGRGSSMDIQLKDSEVSRRHAMVEIRGEVATLIDLGATNGTFVSGERIQRTDISNQSEFTLGSTTLMLIVTPLGNGGM